jgi:hypothetical protein
MRALGVVALGIGLAASAAAREHRVDRANVPGAVLAAVSAKYSTGTMTRFTKEEEHGKIVYEVTVELGADRRELDVSPEGKIQGEERTLPFEQTPTAVQKAFAHSRFGKGSVLRAEESTRYLPTLKVTYELLVRAGERKLELVYDAKGKLVGREPGEED